MRSDVEVAKMGFLPSSGLSRKGGNKVQHVSLPVPWTALHVRASVWVECQVLLIT